jgi:hypothetical protein
MNNFIDLLKKHTIPFLIGGSVFLFMYVSLFSEGPSPDPDAQSQVARFRYKLAFRRGHGLWYDTAAYRKFIDTFSNLVKYADNPQIDHSDPTKYHWVIGFYWTRRQDWRDNKVKYGYCMIPTLLQINGKDTTVLDYYDDAENPDATKQHYNHKFDGTPIRHNLTDNDTINNAFDNGQLWP